MDPDTQRQDADAALSARTATLLVVASMVGTGVFTTTGYLVADLGSIGAVLLCWILGGAAAFCGALAYGELGAALPENGGEYALLGRIYHPALGFTAGFISLFVGFAAPIAASAIAFGAYLNRVFPGGPAGWPTAAGIGLIVATSLLHMSTVRRGSAFQNAATLLKIGFVVLFVVGGLIQMEPTHLRQQGRSVLDASVSGEFAVGLVYVSFAYTGWNAAAYVAGETRDPGRSLPRAFGLGTLLVTILYVGLNLVFLGAVPMEALEGQTEVGHIAAEALFGEAAGRTLSAMIALGLISTVGAMVFTGPRIYEAMGRRHPRLARFAGRSAGGGPRGATLLQGLVAIAMALSARFDELLLYTGATLSLTAMVTAAGVFVLRWREPRLPRPYRAWGHPVTTLAFIALNLWMVIHSILERPTVALWSSVTVVAGLLAYLALGRTPT